MWKALAYLNQSSKKQTLPTLRKDTRSYEEDQDKADLLLQTFFPPQPAPQGGQEADATAVEAEVTDPIGDRLLEEEVARAIFESNPRKAPGPDNLSFCVWQELWPVVKDWIVHIYRRSIQLSYLPTHWKGAKIIVIPKPDKPDYTIPKAYRPISLLQTISKGLERIVAQRFSEYLERTGQLALTQFGARPRRSTEQALTILVEKVYDAWRASKVLSLVTFDVQGAYNGVNKEVLQQRLRKCGIPEFFVKWVYSFCSNRSAAIAFDGFCSETADVLQPRLPQGSPLSPILYILFNSDLLIGTINAVEGDMGFVDDYTAWVVGNSAEENTAKLQACIIPRVVYWEGKSGATFEAEKTQFIHFTRNRTKAQRPFRPLLMNGKDIVPKAGVKVLGVYLDEQLRMKEHIQKATQKSKAQAMALSTIRGLRPAAMRQLYMSTVASKLDYAAPVWFQSEKQGSQSNRAFEAIQKIGSRTIVGAYKTAAGPILEAEAGLLPTTLRLERRVLQYITNLHTLPKEHPWWPLTKGFRKRISRFKSPLV